jgi:16S rRNA (guanine(966)-N(2))-methyltransferase RsmD
MMHIITGSARGVRLETLPGENTRPTSERAKEAIFSMLQFDLAGRRVLDLFAGSGQMALEALSRGAAHAVLVDAAKPACSVIEKNAQKTKLAPCASIVNADAARFLAGYTGAPFHLVFLDPPYAAGLLPSVLRALHEKGMITAGGTVVAECAGEKDLFGGDAALAAQYTVLKSKRYGVAHVFVLTPAERRGL